MQYVLKTLKKTRKCLLVVDKAVIRFWKKTQRALLLISQMDKIFSDADSVQLCSSVIIWYHGINQNTMPLLSYIITLL